MQSLVSVEDVSLYPLGETKYDSLDRLHLRRRESTGKLCLFTLLQNYAYRENDAVHGRLHIPGDCQKARGITRHVFRHIVESPRW